MKHVIFLSEKFEAQLLGVSSKLKWFPETTYLAKVLPSSVHLTSVFSINFVRINNLVILPMISPWTQPFIVEFWFLTIILDFRRF